MPDEQQHQLYTKPITSTGFAYTDVMDPQQPQHHQFQQPQHHQFQQPHPQHPAQQQQPPQQQQHYTENGPPGYAEEGDAYSVGMNLPRATSAPPIMELSSKTLFAFQTEYSHVFGDIRLEQHYDTFYKTYNDPSKLPKPIDQTPFNYEQWSAQGDYMQQQQHPLSSGQPAPPPNQMPNQHVAPSPPQQQPAGNNVPTFVNTSQPHSTAPGPIMQQQRGRGGVVDGRGHGGDMWNQSRVPIHAPVPHHRNSNIQHGQHMPNARSQPTTPVRTPSPLDGAEPPAQEQQSDAWLASKFGNLSMTPAQPHHMTPTESSQYNSAQADQLSVLRSATSSAPLSAQSPSPSNEQSGRLSPGAPFSQWHGNVAAPSPSRPSPQKKDAPFNGNMPPRSASTGANGAKMDRSPRKGPKSGRGKRDMDKGPKGDGGPRRSVQELLSKYPRLEELQGKLYNMSKDQYGCRYLQKQVEDNRRYTDMVYKETFDHIVELMTDPFGNYLCQKLLEHCSDQQRLAIIRKASPDLVNISLNMHGTRAVQKLIEYLRTPQQIDLVVDALRASVVTLIKDLNGNHVIQRCLNRLSSSDKQFIYDAVRGRCTEVATHRHGCCVLQRCIDFASEQQKMQLVDEIASNSLQLVQDPFGNYVVQYVLDLGVEKAISDVITRFFGHVCDLSTNKFSSNVIEKCLRLAPAPLRVQLIQELQSADRLQQLLQDSFGNYVVQTAMNVSDVDQFNIFAERIKPMLPMIRNTPYGKKIENKLAKRGSMSRSRDKQFSKR